MLRKIISLDFGNISVAEIFKIIFFNKSRTYQEYMVKIIL